MSLAEIKAAILKLAPFEQAKLDLWLQHREEKTIRQAHFRELREKLQESYGAVAAGRVRPWNKATFEEIRREAHRCGTTKSDSEVHIIFSNELV